MASRSAERRENGRRMFSYRLPPVASLASQIKRGPGRLRLRHLYNIEFLLSVTDPEKKYPFDFVCHTLTGYRPRGGETTATALLAGAALRGDLITLAEDVSASADIEATAWAERVYSVCELARRFDVSTKTIFRWHRRGLVGWRFRGADRRWRLGFPEHCIRRFVAENLDLVTRGSAFSQLTPEERSGITARARALAESGHKTVNAVAKVIAAETGRAVETIRLILKQYDDAHPRAGVFNRSELRVEPDDQRLAVWEAYVDGATVEGLAARFDRPLAWVYRTITQMRARELQARQIEFVPSPEFEATGADASILNDPDLAQPYAPLAGDGRVPKDLPPYLAQLFRLPLLTPAGEVALFRKMNYLKFKADRLRKALDPETASARALDEIEELLAEAGRLKNQITQANLRLVVSIAKRHVSAGADFFELVSDGNVSLMRAIDKFDYTRGFKLSTYCSWAIMKNYARSVPEQRGLRERYHTGCDEVLATVAGPAADDHEDDFLPAVRATLDRMLAVLDEREQTILRHRYGLDTGGEPQTLDQIGRSFGVSKERIRQLEARAMARLRADFESEARQLLGA